MMAAEKWDSAAILAIPALEPERLFGADPSEISKVFRMLAKRWHSDHNTSPEATPTFEHIVELRNFALEKAKRGDWRIPGLATFETDTGKTFEVRYRKRHEFELGEIFVGMSSIVYALDADATDLAIEAKRAFEAMTYSTPEMKTVYEPRMPTLIKSFVASNRHVFVFKKTPDQILLQDLVEHMGGRLDPKHVAWIVSDLESIASYLEMPRVGWVHPAISPANLLVSPRHHSTTLVGGWWYGAEIGKKLIAAPPRTMNYVPPVLIQDGVAHGCLTLETLRLTACEALGYSSPVLLQSPPVPPPLKKWLLDPPPKTAIEDYRSWATARDASFGPRRFIDFDIDPEAIYPPL